MKEARVWKEEGRRREMKEELWEDGDRQMRKKGEYLRMERSG